MSVINISDLTFGYDGSYENVFENVSFRLDTDWKLGFTGRNGRGKTTFLRLLMGELEYRGSISASAEFEYFPYEVRDKNAPTLDIAAELSGQAHDWEIIRELSLMSADPEILYRPFSALSGGEQTKAMLAAMFLRENSFLLIDEPTNHLDMNARELLGRYLNSKKGFILVSHDRAFLDSCTDHTLSINRADITVHKGNFSSWLENKELSDRLETAENERLTKQIKQLRTAARTAREHSDKIAADKIGFDPKKTEKSSARRPSMAAKSKKLMNRAKAIETRIDTQISEKSKLLHNIEKAEAIKITPLKYYSNVLCEVDNVSIYYDGRYICRNIGFKIMQGERIALCGKNGCGKSSLLRLISGEDVPHTGRITGNEKLKISRLPQHTDGISGSLAEIAQRENIDESLFKAILRKLDFSRELFDRPVQSYSEGQKKKTLIAASLCSRAHLYIWDEPLNFIDVLSRTQIEQMLINSEATVIFAEHDRAFAENTGAEMIFIDRGGK
ncbi:MAG: ABC-F type ribosomal protection protein [Ruminococcus sp.]|nr:ABC-F type ribosomal protection protein [Ruminococcus sp.]